MQPSVIFKKKTIFRLFHEWGRFGKYSYSNIRKSLISLLIGKNLEVQPKTNTKKIPSLNLWMNWENFCPNLSFTVENKIGNLHKIRLTL